MNIEKLKLIDSAISSKNTGNPGQFSDKLGISRSMLHRYINYLKEELGAPIKYQRSKITYEYTELGKLNIHGWETVNNEKLTIQ